MVSPLNRITHGRPVLSIPVGGLGTGHIVAHRPEASTVLHSHSRASLTLVICGAFEERAADRARACGALSVLFKPAGFVHASATGRHETRTFTFAIDEDRLSDELRAHERAVRIIGGPASVHLLRGVVALVGCKEAVKLEADAAHGVVAECLAGALREVERIVVLRANEGDDEESERTAGVLASGARVRDAASSAGVHPVVLARRFRAAQGCAPAEYRRRCRVGAAAGAMARRRESLAGVAALTGFADQAHLTRSFRRETGLTPTGYRDLLERCFSLN